MWLCGTVCSDQGYLDIPGSDLTKRMFFAYMQAYQGQTGGVHKVWQHPSSLRGSLPGAGAVMSLRISNFALPANTKVEDLTGKNL